MIPKKKIRLLTIFWFQKINARTNEDLEPLKTPRFDLCPAQFTFITFNYKKRKKKVIKNFFFI